MVSLTILENQPEKILPDSLGNKLVSCRSAVIHRFTLHLSFPSAGGNGPAACHIFYLEAAAVFVFLGRRHRCRMGTT